MYYLYVKLDGLKDTDIKIVQQNGMVYHLDIFILTVAAFVCDIGVNSVLVSCHYIQCYHVKRIPLLYTA